VLKILTIKKFKSHITKENYEVYDSSSQLVMLTANNDQLSPETINILLCLRAGWKTLADSYAARANW